MANFGLIVGTRGGFPTDIVVEGREKAEKLLKKLDYNVLIPAADATPFGAVGNVNDAVIWADYFRAHSKEIDGFIVTLPNFGDEAGVAETIRRSGVNVPVLIHGAADDLSRMMADQRRGAYCGKPVCLQQSLSVRHSLYRHYEACLRY